MALKICIVGVGQLARMFVPLFKLHPLVDAVALADLDPGKLEWGAREYGIEETYQSLDAACASDCSAVALFTQNWLHGPQAVQALRAGKDVYSSVPTAISLDEVVALVRAVEETGLIYMMAETSYYYPAVIYCRQRQAAGDFGAVVYGEAEYYHDWDHGLYEIVKIRGGENWLDIAGQPPMHYPTHSTSQIISVTGARMTHVSCQGFVDGEDRIYAPGVNRWGNRFSNESALFKMSDGSACRINEFRRIGHPGAVRMTLFGTEASFEHSRAGAAWLTKERDQVTRLDDLLATGDVPTERGVYHGLSTIHSVERLPATYAGLPSGHSGSHQFLVDDFVHACISRAQAPNNVWQAARYAVPGIIAHESAMRGGELLAVPDFGDPPA